MWTDTREDLIDRPAAASTLGAGGKAGFPAALSRLPAIYSNGPSAPGLQSAYRQRRDLGVMTRDGVRLSVRDSGAQRARRTVAKTMGRHTRGM